MFLVLIKFIFFFNCTFTIIPKKPLPNPRSQRFIPIFFLVLYFKLLYLSVINLELNFVHDVKRGFNLIHSLCVDI